MEILPHYKFVDKIKSVFFANPIFVGVAVGGSYMDKTLDAYSDLDVHLVVEETSPILDFDAKATLLQQIETPLCCYANGHDARVLVCLYDYAPYILHVDWKWQTLKEFEQRVENPEILFERNNALSSVMARTDFSYPIPDIHWLEQRFWSWMHYALTKVGRGEILEASDYLSEVRSCCIGPLLLYKNGLSPRRMRRAESLPEPEWEILSKSLQNEYTAKACFEAIMGMIQLYQYLRESYIGSDFQPLKTMEAALLKYANKIQLQVTAC